MKKYLWLLMLLSIQVFAASTNDFGVSITVKNKINFWGIPVPLARIWISYQDASGKNHEVYIDSTGNSNDTIVINSESFKVLHVNRILLAGTGTISGGGQRDFYQDQTVYIRSNWWGGQVHVSNS